MCCINAKEVWENDHANFMSEKYLRVTMPQIVEKARCVAISAHAGQFRRDGVTPYWTHPEAVANQFDDSTRKAVAWLHDVLEDSEVSVADLWTMDFPPVVIHAVDALTKREGVGYFIYIQQVCANPVARAVKIEDIKHNLASDPKPDRIEQYRQALAILECSSKTLMPEAGKICRWQRSIIGYQTDCRSWWSHNNEDQKFCPYCGGKVIAERITQEDE